MKKPLFLILIYSVYGWLDLYAQNSNERINTVGLFAFHPAQEKHYQFWKACGYNTIQFIDIAISLPKEKRKEFYEKTRRGIDDAHKAGLKVGIIIQSNILPYPKNWWETYDLDNKDSTDARLNEIREGARELSNADFFTFFSGDPGGSTRPMGLKGVEKWMEMSRKVHEIVKREAPHAFYNANIWAITHWDHIGISPFTVDFWDKEITYGKKIISENHFIDKNCGIEFPLHNYYRSLAFKSYADADKDPELFPVAADIKKLKSRGVKRMWGWAHFIIDEVDDGYTGYSGTKRHPSQSETRYIYQLISGARKAELNGMFSFTDGPGSEIEAINVYAFGRFCVDASLTPAAAIDEFSAYIANKDSKPLLAQVIRFIENNSTWEASIPMKFQIKKFDCNIADATQALQHLALVVPNPDPSFPLPEDPAEYLEKLKRRLEDIRANDSAVKAEALKNRQEERLKQDWASLKYFQEENRNTNAANPGESRAVFMGNSITAQWKTLDAGFFRGKLYINRGIGGQTTAQMLVRFRQDVIDLKPAVVVIMGGTNDLAGLGGLVSVENIFGNIVSMAELAKANGIKVVLCSVLPAYDYACCPGMDPAPKIADLNQRLRAYAEGNKTAYVDYFSAMVNEENKGMKAALTLDGVHPNKEGYHIMEPLVEKAIRSVLMLKP